MSGLEIEIHPLPEGRGLLSKKLKKSMNEFVGYLRERLMDSLINFF